jgi:hypothetical protein
VRCVVARVERVVITIRQLDSIFTAFADQAF